jgi:putative ABC transport system permease protein
MNLAGLAIRNVGRNRFRSLMTIGGVAIAVLTFVLLSSVNNSLLSASDAHDTARLYATNRLSWYLPMPRKYAEQVPASVPGVEAVTFTNNFSGKLPSDPTFVFTSLAVNAPTFLDVFTEIVVSPEDKQGWLEDRQGALIGEILAKKLGLKIGDRISLKGTRYRGDWTFNVRGIYKINKDTWDRSSVFFHWTYLNDQIPAIQKDQINWVAMRVPGSQSSAAGSAIERTFADREVPLRCFTHDGLNKQIGAMFVSAVRALSMMSFAILAILTMILSNTIASGVRERTRESGVLRAIGFSEWKIAFCIMGESIALAVAGGVLGLALSYPLVQEGLGRALTETANAVFPTFSIRLSTVVASLLLCVLLGAAAAFVPAYRTLRIRLVDALRHTD